MTKTTFQILLACFAFAAIAIAFAGQPVKPATVTPAVRTYSAATVAGLEEDISARDRELVIVRSERDAALALVSQKQSPIVSPLVVQVPVAKPPRSVVKPSLTTQRRGLFVRRR